MRINFNTALIDVRDNTALTFTYRKTPKDIEGEERELTFGWAAAEALGAQFPDEQNITQKDKLQRGRLIEQIFTRPESEISIEEASLIKQRIGKVYGPLVVIAVEKVLETAPALSVAH